MTNTNIDGKVVVITGASSGIGESTARLLARHGAKLVLAARRKDRLDRLTRAINVEGGSAVAIETDVTRRVDVEALMAGAMSAHGRVDVLLNNAGVMPIAPMAALEVEQWDRMIDVNIKGVLYGVAAVLPIMRHQKQGHIINVASVLGFKVFAPGGVVYSATKFAVRALTEGLRIEHRADNIRCTLISPGAVATELPETSATEEVRAQMRQFYQIAMPADSIARAIAYAIEQPAEVEIGEVVLRPSVQEF